MIAVLFGVFEAGSAAQVIASVPEILWEASLGIYLVVKGFKPSPITAIDATIRVPESPSAVREGS
jgi:hypothetical protein